MTSKRAWIGCTGLPASRTVFRSQAQVWPWRVVSERAIRQIWASM